jgi:hypothetical protein
VIATDPFFPNGHVRRALFALVLVGLALMAVDLPSASAIYPPLLALLLSPLALLRRQTAVLVWQAVNVAMLYGVYVEWRRIYRTMRPVPAPGWLVVATAVAIGVPVVMAMQSAHMGVLILYTTILGFSFALCGDDPAEWWAAGIVLAIPAAIHLSPAIAGFTVVLMFLARDRKRGMILAASFVTGLALWLFVVPSLVLGWGRNLQLLKTFAEGATVLASKWSLALGAICILAILLLARRLIREGSALELTVIFGLACAAALFYAPAAWPRQFTLALPFVGATPLLLLDRGRPAAARLLALGCAAAVVLQALVA